MVNNRGILFPENPMSKGAQALFIQTFVFTFLEIPNIEPIAARHSMFDEPSNGSKKTMYFPCLSVSTSMTFSSSSDTSRHVV